MSSCGGEEHYRINGDCLAEPKYTLRISADEYTAKEVIEPSNLCVLQKLITKEEALSLSPLACFYVFSCLVTETLPGDQSTCAIIGKTVYRGQCIIHASGHRIDQFVKWFIDSYK
jgi:hypothetical protein